MSTYTAPLVMWLDWTAHGDYLHVATSARTGCTYLVIRMPCKPEGALWIRFKPNMPLMPYFTAVVNLRLFTAVANIRTMVQDAKTACAQDDAYQPDREQLPVEKVSEE